MNKSTLLFGVFGIGVGAAGMVYLLDKKKGEKRRAEVRDRLVRTMSAAGEKVGEYSRDFGHAAGEYIRNGNANWSPSARFLGAIGSAFAVYGAGRPGLLGIVLRTLSLGIFTRALMTSR